MADEPRMAGVPRISDCVAVSDIIGYPPRTQALAELSSRGTPMTLDTLSRRVADSLSTDLSGPTASTVRRTSIQLHHSHLPLLDDAGVITYDPAERVVTSMDGERLDALLETGRQILESLRDEQFDRA